MLEGEVPGGRRLGRREIGGNIVHLPGRDVTLSAPKSVSLMALVGGDERIVEAHDRAVAATLNWIEEHAVETRMRDPATRAMVRAGDQGMVAATFRHDTSRNLDPQLHTHAVIANMVQGEDGKWRTMVDDGLFGGKPVSPTIRDLNRKPRLVFGWLRLSRNTQPRAKLRNRPHRIRSTELAWQHQAGRSAFPGSR